MGLHKEDMDILDEDELNISKNPPYYEEDENNLGLDPEGSLQSEEDYTEKQINNELYSELVNLEKRLSQDIKRLSDLDMVSTKKLISLNGVLDNLRTEIIIFENIRNKLVYMDGLLVKKSKQYNESIYLVNYFVHILIEIF